MIGVIVSVERKRFVQRGAGLAALLLIAVAMFYAGWSGQQWRDSQSKSLDVFQTGGLAELAEWRAELETIERGEEAPSPYAANPMNISFPAILNPSPLGDFAIGHASLHPASAEISAWRNSSNVFGRYQFDNPLPLAVGSFDLKLVITMLMPILMIAVSFDVLARDREQHSLGMILAAPVSLAKLAWTRLLFRNGLLWSCAVLVMTLLLWINEYETGRVARFGIWLAISLCYGGFWLALIALCVARLRTAAQAVAVLASLWVLFTLAIPSAVSTAAEASYPTPSRLAFLAEIRTAQGETNLNLASLTDSFLTDHPDLTVGDEGVPSYFRATFLSNEAAEERTRPIIQAYEDARANRASLLAWAQLLSPSIIAERSLSLAAGADLERQYAYQTQVYDALGGLASSVGPAIVSRNRISLAMFDELPPFSFQDRTNTSLGREVFPPTLFLFLLSVALMVAAHRLFRRESNGV